MLHDFLPAIVSIGILTGAFFIAWISDARRIRRFHVPELVQARVHSTSEIESRVQALDLDGIR
jgi:hypothetical protein